MTNQKVWAEFNLGGFIEAKRDELNLTLLDVKNMTGISVDDQIQIEWNLQFPTERQLMQYRSMNMLPEEEEEEAVYVAQLPEAEQAAIRQRLTDLLTLEVYSMKELEQAVQDGMDSRVSDLPEGAEAQ